LMLDDFVKLWKIRECIKNENRLFI
jgi:hypothetical protein